MEEKPTNDSDDFVFYPIQRKQYVMKNSEADTLDKIITETLQAVTSERASRAIDKDSIGSMERRKREGYF